MNKRDAKRLAREHGRDLWWDRSIQLWTLTAIPTTAEPDADVNTPAEHLSAGALFNLNAEQFAASYLPPKL